MRDQEQFLQVVDRDEAERRFRAAVDLAPRGIMPPVAIPTAWPEPTTVVGTTPV